MKKSWKSALALCLALALLMSLCALSLPAGAEGDAAGSGSDIREVSVRLDDANHTLRMVKQSDRWYICAEDLALLAGLATGVNEDTVLAYFVRRGESAVILYTGTDFIRRDGNIFVPAQEATVACGVKLMEYNGQLVAEILRTPKDLDQELYDHVFPVPVFKLERYIVEGGWVVGGFHFFSIWYDMITNPSRVFEYLTQTNDYSYYLNALTSLMTYDEAKVGLLNGFLTADKALIKVSKFFSGFDKASEKVALFYNKLTSFSDAEAEWKTFVAGIDVYGDFGPIRYFLLEDGGKILKTLNSIANFDQVKDMVISMDAEASSVSVVANVFSNSNNPAAQNAAQRILAWYNGGALGAAYGVTDIFNNLLGMAVDTKLDDVLTGKVTFGSWLATAAEKAVLDWIFHTDKQVEFALYMPVYTDIQQTLALYYFSEKDQALQSGDLSLMRGVALMYLNANLKVFDMLAFEDDLDLSATAQSVLAEMECLLSYDPDEFCPQYDNAILISYAEKAPAAVQDTAEEGASVPAGSGSPVGIWEAVNLREALIDETVATLNCSREEAERYVDEMGELYARIEFCEDGTVRMERSIGYDAGTGDGTWTADDDGFNVTEENFYPRRNLDYGGIWIEVTDESSSIRILPVYRFVWNGDCLSATKVDFSVLFWIEDGEPVQESGPAVLFRRAGNVPVEEEEEEFAPVPADFRSPVGSWEAVNLREVISAAYELSGKSPEEAEQIVNAGKGLFMRMEFRADGTFSMEGDMGSGASYADGKWLVTETDGGTGIMMLVGNEPAGLLMWNGDCLSASGLGVDLLFEKTGEPDATETGSASSSFHAGDIIRFGEDKKWTILDKEGSYATLLLSDGYYSGSFDSTLHAETRAISLMDYRTYGQACWMYSELRQWLNSEEEQFQARDADIGYDNYEQALSGMGLVADIEWESDAECPFNGCRGFLRTFSPAERSIMVPVEITALAPYTMVKTNGYTHTSVDLDQLYSVGTGTLTTTDLVYLLSAREYADYAARGINVYTDADGEKSFPQSWTRDSYDYNLAGYYSYYGMDVVTVTNGYFSSASAESVAAVRPVCRIDLSKIGAFSGSGTADDPYCLNLAPDEEEDTNHESPVGSGAVVSDSPYAQVGSIVTYGTYPQTAESTGTPIEWLVLDYDANTNRALLISRYGLDCMRFDRDHEYSEGIESGKWDTCTLRAWLNGEFLNTAFEPALRGAIAETRLTPEENRGYITLTPEAETVDRIFLLSISEAKKYFASDADRVCVPTTYALSRGVSAYDAKGTPEGVSCWWWLRTRGDGYNGGMRVATVIDDGSIVDFGYAYFEESFAVRPAFWLDLSGL